MLSGNLPGRRFQWANFSANWGGYLIFLEEIMLHLWLNMFPVSVYLG